MKCSICGTTLDPGADRCPTCGYRCRSTYTPPRSAQSAKPGSYVPYDPPNKKSGSKGCCCAAAVFIPAIALLLLWLFTGVSVLIEDFTVMTPEPAPAESIPYVSVAPDSEDYFTIADGVLMFCADTWDGGPVLSIPDTVAGQSVTAIGEGCFRNCSDLTTILLPDTVTEIADSAFSGCTKLRGLHIPEGVTSIGTDAFAGCIEMEAVYIPASVEFIAEGCFDDCASLMYLFYEGTFESWDALYDDYINPYTTAICLDGYYYHGAED